MKKMLATFIILISYLPLSFAGEPTREQLALATHILNLENARIFANEEKPSSWGPVVSGCGVTVNVAGAGFIFGVARDHLSEVFSSKGNESYQYLVTGTFFGTLSAATYFALMIAQR